MHQGIINFFGGDEAVRFSNNFVFDALAFRMGCTNYLQY
jgi:hypothetical protein